MQGIYADGDLITPDILDVLPSKATHKVTNQLLDGSWHVQTIGSPATRVKVSLVTDWQGMETLNVLESTGGLVQVVTEDPANDWTGIIEAPPSWRKSGKLYFGEFSLLEVGA